MWPLPDQDEVNDLMTWQHELVVMLRRGWRKLSYVVAALVFVALLINPSWNVALQVAIALAALVAFELILAFAAWLALSFVEKDKRP